MSGNNTSGYEIRQGLLGQAQDILQTNAQMHYERTKEWVPITTEAIIAEADRLNTFVQRKGSAAEGPPSPAIARRPRNAAEARRQARPGPPKGGFPLLNFPPVDKNGNPIGEPTFETIETGSDSQREALREFYPEWREMVKQLCAAGYYGPGNRQRFAAEDIAREKSIAKEESIAKEKEE